MDLSGDFVVRPRRCFSGREAFLQVGHTFMGDLSHPSNYCDV